MVIFKEIEMEGFKNYDNKKSYDFQEGLTGIFGKNESGKSSIGDAINVSLFGLDGKSYKKSDIITWEKSKCNLRLDFELDKLYRVKRTIGTKSSAVLEINNNGRWEIIEKSITSVDNRLQDILGLDSKSFKNSIFIGQNELDSLSSLNKQDRQAIINRLSRYDELSKAEKVLKEDLRELKHNLEILNKEFDNLKEIVEDKNKKFERLQELIKEKSGKEEEIHEEITESKIIINEIQICEELKILYNINDKIDSLDKRINETNDQLSLIEQKELDKKDLEEKIEYLSYVNEDLKTNIRDIEKIISDIKDVKIHQNNISRYESLIIEKENQIDVIIDKESQKENILKKLSELSHVNTELKDNIEKIGNILIDINGLKDSKSELKRLESLIDEKKGQISKIDTKESEKEVYEKDLIKFNHVNSELKEKITNISKTLAKLNSNDIELDKTKISIEELKKNIKDCKTLINEKESQISIINSKETQIRDIQLKIKDLDHINQDLDSKIEYIGIIISDLSSLKVELSKVEENKKLKIKILKDEDELREDHDKYADFLEINNILDVKGKEINDTESTINLKKQELGELNEESLDLKVIESEYESKLSRANKFIFIGVLIVIIGLIFGFVFNFLLFLIFIIGLMPLYKGYNDRKKFIAKLKVIKDNREVIGYLKELEIYLTNLKDEYKDYNQKLNEYEKLDINLLKQNFETFNSLNKEKFEFNELEKSENSILNKINQYNKELTQYFESLPDQFKNDLTLNDKNLYKLLTNLYQEEDKKKSNYKNSLNDLEAQISGKSENQNELNKFLDEKNDLIVQLTNKENLLKELLTKDKELKNDLEKKYNALPLHYKNKIPIQYKRLDKEISSLFQEENMSKSRLKERISALDKEIRDKPTVLNILEKLENDRYILEEHVSKEEKNLNSNLEDSFEILPSHYKKTRSSKDETLYKDILTQYQGEDKSKDTYKEKIKELNKEIEKKPIILKEKQDLIDKKTSLEEQILSDNIRLRKELKDKYEILPKHYKKLSINDEDLGKKLRENYQIDDKEKSNFLTRIKDLNIEIGRKIGIQNKLKELEKLRTEFVDEQNNQKNLIRGLTDQENLKYNEKDHKELKERDNRLNEKIKEHNQEIWNLEGNIGTLKEETEDLENKKESLNELITEIQDKEFNWDVNEIAKDEISLTAKWLREQVMERTEKYVGNFLPRITNNKYRDVKIEEDFKIKVYSPEKSDFVSINSLSGGTKDQVLFALRLAFTNAIIGGRSRGKGFALFLDEFLGSFDQNRRIRTLKMLKGLKNYFRQIFLISHIEGLEMDVDHVIRTPEQ